MPTFRDRWRAFLHPLPVGGPAPAAMTASPSTSRLTGKDPYAAKPIKGLRQTQPSNYNPFGLSGWYFLPQRQYEQIDITELDVTAFTANQLFALLPDLSPEMGKAVWTFLRFAGTSVTWTAMTPNGEENEALQRELDDVVLGLNPQFGGIDAILTQLELSAYLNGSVCLDVAPTPNLKDIDDIYPVAPDSIFFERDAEQRLVPFQRQAIWHAGGAMPYRMMNEETFFFVPVDAYIDDPYGRSPIAPVLGVVFGWAQVLRDLAKVVHHQGWPKLDMSLVWELMEPVVPPHIKDDPAALQTWMADRMRDVATAYDQMAPEDAFVHFDYVKLNSEAASAGSKLFDVRAITEVFRMEMIESLKSLPIFHGGGMANGETETYGSIEFEVYAMSVAMLRNVITEVMERALTVSLNLRGIDAIVHGEWDPIRTTARLSDAQAEAAEIENAVSKRDQGWITQDDASTDITGSEAVAPPPAAALAPYGPPVPGPQPMPPGDDTEAGRAIDVYGHGFELAYIGAALEASRRVLDGADRSEATAVTTGAVRTPRGAAISRASRRRR